MTKSKRIRARAAQRNPENNKLIYNVGTFGGTLRPDDDLAGVRKPKNRAEGECFDLLRKNGWTPTKRGWPDFFCLKDGKVCAIEVKPHKGSLLKQNQIAVMGILSSFGIPCYLWSPDGGFEAVHGYSLPDEFSQE